jgi:23S rRNA (guanine745-N1)-methyltransferase
MLDGRVRLLCSVHGCARELRAFGKDLVCERNHRFNVARSGYVNLLQPQQRHARHPGDSKAAVDARRRWLDAGGARPLIDALAERIAALELAHSFTALDLGCGEGTFLAAIRDRFACEAWGIDISTPAIDAAARRHDRVNWIVANADLALPFADRSFALVLSVTGRRNAAEVARVLGPSGRALFVVPAEDDLAELRAAVLGEARREDRFAKLVEELAPALLLEDRSSARWTQTCDAAALRDLAAATYRGARNRERDRLAAVESLDVTSSYAIGCFRGA